MNNNPQIYHGEWWVPAVADRDTKMMGHERKYTGTLTYYGDKNSTLELYHTPSNFHSKHYCQNDVIWGRDANGIKILLKQVEDVDCIQKCNINPKTLTDSRDFYSHLFPDEEKKSAVESEDLYWLTEKCKVLLTCCILNLLGLTNKEINLCCEQSPISQIIDSLPLEIE